MARLGLSVATLARALRADAAGDTSLVVNALAEPASAGPGDLALAMSPRYAEALKSGRAQAAVIWPGADWQGMGLKAAIFAGRPRLMMAGLTQAFDDFGGVAPGIHATAQLDPSARIGPRARIGAYVTIGANTVIGADALIHPGVHIGHDVLIGARFIAQSGAVIGGDGFSFVTAEPSVVEQVRHTLGESDAVVQPWHRIHSLGGVVIGDDVEIGANSCVDRGTIRATEVGDGSKLDNLVQVGHNVRVGRHCLLCGQVGIAGSSIIGDHVVLGGQAGVVDNLTIGERVVVAAGSLVLSNVPAGRAMMGNPATEMQAQIASYKALRRLPRLLSRLKKD